MTDQKLRLHWSPRSPFVRKVMIAAHEAGLAEGLELVRTVVASGAPNQELMLENPLSQLPTLTMPDGAPSLFDSAVIIEFFHQLAPQAGLLPQAGRERLAALRHQALGNGLLSLMLLWGEERRRPEASRSQALLTAYRAKFHAVVDHMDAEVDMLRGRQFDIGHISVGCGLGYVVFRFAELDWAISRPGLATWLKEFDARPSVRAVPVIDDLASPIDPSAAMAVTSSAASDAVVL